LIKSYLVNSKTSGQILLSDGMIFGRSDKAHVPIDDRSLSKSHIRITIMGKRVAIVDLDSASGTKVNGKPITPNIPVSLNINDVIEIGEQSFKFTQAEVEDEIKEEEVEEEKFTRTEVEVGDGPPPEPEFEIVMDNAAKMQPDDFANTKAVGKVRSKKGTGITMDGEITSMDSVGEDHMISRPKRTDGGGRIPKPELPRYSSEELNFFMKDQKEYVEDLKKFSGDLSEKVFEAGNLDKEMAEIKTNLGPLKEIYLGKRTEVLDSKYEIYNNLDQQIKSLQRQVAKVETSLKDYLDYFNLKEERDILRKKIRFLNQTDLKQELERNNQKVIVEQKYFKELESQHSKNLYFEQQKKRENEMAEKKEIQDEIKKLQDKMKKMG